MSFMEHSSRTLRRVGQASDPPSAPTSPQAQQMQQPQHEEPPASPSSLTIQQAEAYLRYMFTSGRDWYRCEITVPRSHCNHKISDATVAATPFLVKKSGHDFALELLIAFPSLARQTYRRFARPTSSTSSRRRQYHEDPLVEWSPLVHFLYAGSVTTAAAIQSLLELDPSAATMCHHPYDNLPLHMACHRGVAPDVMALVINAHPPAVLIRNTSDYLPLHYFLERRADQDPHLPPAAYRQTLQLLVKDHPQTLLQPNNDQRSPLDMAIYLEHDLDVLQLMISYLPHISFDGTYRVNATHRWQNFNLDVPASQRLALLLPHLHQFQCVPPYLTPNGCIHLLGALQQSTRTFRMELELAPVEDPIAAALQLCLQHNRALHDWTLCTSMQGWRSNHHHRALAAVKRGLDLQVANTNAGGIGDGLQHLKLQRWQVFTSQPDIRFRSPDIIAANNGFSSACAPRDGGDNDEEPPLPPCGGLFSDFLAKGAAPPTLILDHAVFHGEWRKESHIRNWNHCRLERLTIEHFQMTPAILLGFLSFLTHMPRLKELVLWHSVDDQDDDMLLLRHLQEDHLETCDITTPLAAMLQTNVIQLLDIGGLRVDCQALQQDLVRNTSLTKFHVDVTPVANSATNTNKEEAEEEEVENDNEAQPTKAMSTIKLPTCPETDVLLTVLKSNTTLLDIGFNNCHDEGDDDMVADGHVEGEAAFVAHLDKHPQLVYYTNLNRFGRGQARSPDTTLEQFVELLCHAVDTVADPPAGGALDDWLLMWMSDQDGTPVLLPETDDEADDAGDVDTSTNSKRSNRSPETRVTLTLWNVLYGLLREAPTLWSHAMDHHYNSEPQDQQAGKKRKRITGQG